jgi:thymidylate kinase
MLIIIIGPDGSGKTTIANGIQKEMRAKGVKAHHLAMNFEIIPKLRDIINPFRKNKVVSTHYEGEHYGGMKDKPNSKVKGIVLTTWYTLDYFLGYFKLAKFSIDKEVVIFARYFYDYFFQRAHINTPTLYLKFLEFFIPTPDYIFTIKRSPEDIFNLKPELSISEIKRQQDILERLLLSKRSSYVIDGSSGVDSTIEKIMNIVESNR